jgi:two-component system, NarL family, nitrate/nitrite response regulator NarL
MVSYQRPNPESNSRLPSESRMVRASSLELGVSIISVLVADSTPLTGYLIADALRKDRGLTVTSSEASSVILTATTLKPDVAIISEQLQGKPGKGFEVLRELRVAVPSTRTVMLLDSAERGLVVEAFRSGARGVFCRSDSLKMLTRCVHKVHEGQLWVSGPELQFLLETLAQAPATRIVDTRGTNLLSKREQDVVRWLVEGNTNTEIARKLNLSENTVKNYLFHIFNKLGVSGRVEVVIYAASQRAVDSPTKLETLADRRNTGS